MYVEIVLAMIKGELCWETASVLYCVCTVDRGVAVNSCELVVCIFNSGYPYINVFLNMLSRLFVPLRQGMY